MTGQQKPYRKLAVGQLGQILAGHAQWLASDMRSGNQARLRAVNLVHANLGGAELSGADLFGANLQGANLEGAKLSRTMLGDADFRGADLRGADLRGVDLRRVKLITANLSGARLQGADLSGAKLIGVKFVHADLSGADLREADLTGADLCRANLRGVKLGGADLSRADLSRANLRGVKLGGADLSGANLEEGVLMKVDLSGAKLEGAGLSGANLSGANLEGADLSGANLSGTNLSGARLQGANLMGASLIGADLEGADLEGAGLGKANLHGAILYETNLEDADLAGAVFDLLRISSVDLSVAKGLGGCKFSGPSAISTSTLQMSNGQIPESFLRGCGLADWEVESVKLYSPKVSAGEIIDIHQRVFDLRNGKPLQFFSVFISYNHQDKAFAQRLFDALQTKGIRCWLDEKQMQPGDDIYEGIDRGIKHWDKLLLCASKHSLTSWWVDLEVNKVFEKERRLFKEREKKVYALIPLNLDGYLFDGYQGAKADEIRSRIAADFTTDADFDTEVEKVIKALRADDGALEALPPKLL